MRQRLTPLTLRYARQATAPSPDAVLKAWTAGLHQELPLERQPEDKHHVHHHHLHLHHHHHREREEEVRASLRPPLLGDLPVLCAYVCVAIYCFLNLTAMMALDLLGLSVRQGGGSMCGCFRRPKKHMDVTPENECANPTFDVDHRDGSLSPEKLSTFETEGQLPDTTSAEGPKKPQQQRRKKKLSMDQPLKS